MALEVFGLLDQDGCNNCGSYIFTGSAGDLRRLAKPLQDYFAKNKRKKKVALLAEKIVQASQLPQPLVRIDKPEGVVFMDVLCELAEGKAASNAAAKLYARLAEVVCVY